MLRLGRVVDGRSRVTVVVALLLSAQVVVTTGVFGQPLQISHEEGTMIVGFHAHVPWPDRLTSVVSKGATVRGFFPQIHAAVLEVPERDIRDSLTAFGRDPRVRYAEPNPIARAMATPDDTRWGDQWGPKKIASETAWQIYPGGFGDQGPGGSGVLIAVNDTGVRSSHVDLDDGRVRTDLGANCLTGICTPSAADDDHGHGTHVAGIIASETNNSEGVAGVAYSSRIIPVKVLNSDGEGTYASVTDGILWAAKKGARVINMSLGGPVHSTALCDAVRTAVDTYGASVVAASGNDASPTISYPAACPDALAIGATDSADSRALYSNYGSELFVSAPGSAIWSTVPTCCTQISSSSGYASLSGTSMATPHVAAQIGLIRSQASGSLSALEVSTLVASTADKVGGFPYGDDPNALDCSCTWNEQFGYGRINAGSALESLEDTFSISVSESGKWLARESSIQTGIEILRGLTHTSAVDLSVTGLPSDVAASFSPDPAEGNSSTLTITTGPAAPYGRFDLTVSGNDGSLEQVDTFEITIGSEEIHRPGFPDSWSKAERYEDPLGSQAEAASSVDETSGSVSVSTDASSRAPASLVAAGAAIGCGFSASEARVVDRFMLARAGEYQVEITYAQMAIATAQEVHGPIAECPSCAAFSAAGSSVLAALTITYFPCGVVEGCNPETHSAKAMTAVNGTFVLAARFNISTEGGVLAVQAGLSSTASAKGSADASAEASGIIDQVLVRSLG